MQELAKYKVAEPVVLVFDNLPLRRAELKAFLTPWAQNLAVQVYAEPMTRLLEGAIAQGECRMIVASVGSLTLEGSAVLARILALSGERTALPVVVLTELPSTRDAAIAFQAGARGFIPASTEPAVALRALTFILNGGHFFPPSALQMLPRLAWRRTPPKLRGAAAAPAGSVHHWWNSSAGSGARRQSGR